MSKLFYFLISVGVTFSSSAFASSSNVASHMGKFWNDMGGMYNSSGASAYDAQSAGFYTLGNLYARTPVKNSRIVSIDLPSASGSCSDINLHKGGFSFINVDGQIETIKAITNNSMGFAFQLGLENLSPVISEISQELQSLIQKVTAMSINSCEAAQTIIGGLWPRHERASKTICSVMANKHGIGDDYVQAKHKCHDNKSNTLDQIRGSNKEGFEKLWVEDINIAWKALKDSGFIVENNHALAELFMNLSGTIIIKAAEGSKPPKFTYMTSKAIDSSFISTLLDGGSIKLFRCLDGEKCLQVAASAQEITIKPEDAFKAKVEKLIASIADKIVRDEDLSIEEKNFLNYKISVPLYKILNVYSAYSGSSALFELPAYTEAIALQMIFKYLEDVLNEVEQYSDSIAIANEDHIKEFKQRLRDARITLNNYQLKSNQNLKTLMTLVDRTQMIEKVLARSLDNSLADAANWSEK